MTVLAEDYASVSDFFGRYCWLVDEGDEDAWTALWTEDGTFVGLGPQPLVGREQLKAIPRLSVQSGPGSLRHLAVNLHCDYGDSRDVVLARLYNYVMDWSKGGAPKIMAICNAILIRDGEYWKIKRNEAQIRQP